MFTTALILILVAALIIYPNYKSVEGFSRVDESDSESESGGDSIVEELSMF